MATDEEGRVLGCGALRIYNEELAEVCSLAVAEEFQGMGIGGMIVNRLIEEARDSAPEDVPMLETLAETLRQLRRSERISVAEVLFVSINGASR